METDVKPSDVFLAFTADQGGNVVKTCTALGVPVIKCNAHCLNSTTILALGITGSVKTCRNPEVERLMKKLAACVGVSSQSLSNKISS